MDLKILTNCKICERRFILDVKYEDFIKWEKGGLIQNCFPYLEPAKRELLISGFCDECWKDLFPPEEDEDETDDPDFMIFDEDDED